jgi:hypothetical protein
MPKKFLLIIISSLLFTIVGAGIVYAGGGLTPVLQFDKSEYASGDIVQMSLMLTGIQAGDKTNSVTYKIDYDGNFFELATGDPENDIVDGYMPLTSKNVTGTGAAKSIVAMYVDIGGGTALQDGAVVFSVGFKVKGNTPPGNKAFTLQKVNMLKPDNMLFSINNGNPLSVRIQILKEPGDINADGRVDIRDLAVLTLAYGSDPSSGRWKAEADMNGDGRVNLADFNILRQNFGK